MLGVAGGGDSLVDRAGAWWSCGHPALSCWGRVSAACPPQECQPGCSSPVSRGADILHSALCLPGVLKVSSGPCVSLHHLDFGGGHGRAGACHLCLQHVSGAAFSSTQADLAPGGPAATSFPLHVLQFLLCWEHCSRGMAGQGLGALARAMRSCNPGSRQGAPRTANICPDPLLLSSRWVPPQAPYLQGQCSPPW